MHIDPTAHEHGATAKVYSYEADFEVGADAITWKATVSEAGARIAAIAGSVPLSSPALPPLAEQIVRDEIVKRIDTLDDTRNGGDQPLTAG